LIWCHTSVYVQTSEKRFYALEHLKKCVLVRADGLSCLKIICITIERTKAIARLHTERRTANPINITFAGENTFKQISECRSWTSSCPEAYRADTFSECLWEGEKDVYSWVEPLCIAALRVIEILELLSKHVENAARGIAGLEPASEWVVKEIVLRALVVRFQGIVEY
jgi:hypothetical protein